MLQVSDIATQVCDAMTVSNGDENQSDRPYKFCRVVVNGRQGRDDRYRERETDTRVTGRDSMKMAEETGCAMISYERRTLRLRVKCC
jgi:hypothetical protein